MVKKGGSTLIFGISDYTTPLWADISVVIFFSFNIITLLIFGLKEIRKKQNVSMEILKLVAMVILLLTPIINILPSLTNGGAAFIKEKDNEPIVCSGKIESICENSKRIPTYKHDHKFGADIVIDGVMYFAPTAGELRIGDTVEVHYLENSKFILKIERKHIE